jgi:DNA polymerase-3 subunit epsilon
MNSCFQRLNVSTPRHNRDLRSRDLCFFDVETTGPVFGFHEIIDIGAIRTSPDGADVKGEWSCRVRPRYPERITIRAREVNGFSEQEWALAREPSRAVWSQLIDFARGCVPIAHNPSFDRAFITLGAASEDIDDLELDYHWIGTESLAWPLYLSGDLPEMSLAALCDFLDISREPDPHRALKGAATCNKIYCALLARQPVQH